jgi:aminoglycoside phosphotransferase (APT) family kinase protein
VSEIFGSFKSDSVDGLIDEARLADWLDAQGLAPGEALVARRISGGFSNESIGIERGGNSWVLRRPAQVALAGADRGMQREFRVLSALEGTPVPHPHPVALCTDGAVIGCAFYLMGFVDGFTSLSRLPEAFKGDAAVRRDAAHSYMDALGELARVDWQGRGLDDYGKPEGFHERQVARWLRQLDSYQARDLPEIREVGAWLGQHLPAPSDWTPGIMHGDYHSANVMLGRDAPGRVVAILDWENATIGDPLLDLAGFLRMFDGSDWAGWAERSDMIEHWEQHSGRSAPNLRYYSALSAFRLAVLLEGVYQRSLADKTRGDAAPMGEMVLDIAKQAREFVHD